MAFASWFSGLRSPVPCQEHNKARRNRLTSSRPILELLEDRLAPAGFGPEDGAYIVESWSGRYREVKIQPTDQKIVAVGTANNGVVIGRYDSQGDVDNAYGSGGTSNPPLSSGSELNPGLILQSDGKAVVAFNTYSPTIWNHGVARFTSSGSLDTSFGSGGWKTVDVRPDDDFSAANKTSVGLQSTGKVVIAGYSYGTSGNPALVARFTTSGAVDTGKTGFGTVSHGKAIGYTLSTFGGTNNSFNELVIQPDDKIVVVGSSTTDGNGGLLMARYTANGVLDTSFNGSGYTVFLPAGFTFAYGFGITRQSDGKFVVVGRCSGIDNSPDMLIGRFNANGTLDTTFGGGSGYVRLDIDGASSQSDESASDVVIQPDGKIVVVGGVSVGSNPSNVLVVRLNSNGTADSGFGAGGFKIGTLPPELGSPHLWAGRIGLLGDGSIIVAGYGDWSGDNHPLLMRFFGASASPLLAASTATMNSTQSITLAQVQPLLTEALARWQSAGYDISSLTNIDLRIADLPGNTLGRAQGQTITLDSNAAGWGWFVDLTPRSDSEFTTPGNQGEQNRMDLLTALAHEIGHLLGHDHDEGGVMADTLASGVRRLPMANTDWLAAVEAVFCESASFKRRP